MKLLQVKNQVPSSRLTISSVSSKTNIFSSRAKHHQSDCLINLKDGRYRWRFSSKCLFCWESAPQLYPWNSGCQGVASTPQLKSWSGGQSESPSGSLSASSPFCSLALWISPLSPSGTPFSGSPSWPGQTQRSSLTSLLLSRPLISYSSWCRYS